VTVLVLGLIALSLLLVTKIFPGRPVALFVVALSIIAVSVGRLDQQGVSIVGPLPAVCQSLLGPHCDFAMWTA
jgi:SulP family sulfate permease